MARKCGDKTPKSDFVVGEAELLHIYPLVIFVVLLYFKLQECNKKAPATAEAISNTKSMKNKVEKGTSKLKCKENKNKPNNRKTYG